MKKLSFALFTLGLGCAAFAQLPKWAIAPKYDNVTMKVDDTLLQTDSVGRTALWTTDGKCLFRTEHFVNPFNDGVAVITKRGTHDLIGFVDASGKFTKLPNAKAACEYPFFEDGYLVCQDEKGFSYYKKDGFKADFLETIRSFPFYRGFAPFLAFAQPDKKKDPYYGYLRADGKEMGYVLLDDGKLKDFDTKDITFLSAIGANNKGVAVIKNKLYLFDPDTKWFVPFLHGDADSDKKKHLVLNGDHEKYFLDLPEDRDTIRITAKYGKNQSATLNFDKQLRPMRFTFDDGDIVIASDNKQEFKYVSDLKPYGEPGKYGLASGSGQLLPGQFEEFGLMFGNRAFAKHNGKWGVIEILPDQNYRLQFNKGEDIAFRHQKFETQVRLDLPAEISAKDARIDIPASSGCVIDKTSRETKDTESGNFVVYDCVLNIPESLPDTITTITYSPVIVSYDGIRLFESPIDVKAWHYKYHNVNLDDSQTSISKGVASFTVNLDIKKNAGEGDYPFEVFMQADSVLVNPIKINEATFKYEVSNLKEGENNLNIIITEKGCPPTVFPIEIYYTKPAPRKKTKEAVVVRKKSPKAAPKMSQPLIPL